MCNPIAPRYQYGILIDTLRTTEHGQMSVEEANGYGEPMLAIPSAVLNLSYCIGNKITNKTMTLRTPYNGGLAHTEPNIELSILTMHSNSPEDSEIRAENEKEEESIWGCVRERLSLDREPLYQLGVLIGVIQLSMGRGLPKPIGNGRSQVATGAATVTPISISPSLHVHQSHSADSVWFA